MDVWSRIRVPASLAGMAVLSAVLSGSCASAQGSAARATALSPVKAYTEASDSMLGSGLAEVPATDRSQYVQAAREAIAGTVFGLTRFLPPQGDARSVSDDNLWMVVYSALHGDVLYWSNTGSDSTAGAVAAVRARVDQLLAFYPVCAVPNRKEGLLATQLLAVAAAVDDGMVRDAATKYLKSNSGRVPEMALLPLLAACEVLGVRGEQVGSEWSHTVASRGEHEFFVGVFRRVHRSAVEWRQNGLAEHER